MNFPKFTAESSLDKASRTYRGRYLFGTLSQHQSGLPANVMPNQLEDVEALDDADPMEAAGTEDEGGEQEVDGMEEETDAAEETEE